MTHTHLQGELFVPEAPQAALRALAVGGERVQLRVGLGQLTSAAPVALQQLRQGVALLTRRRAEEARARLRSLQPGAQPPRRLPRPQLLQGEGLGDGPRSTRFYIESL